MRALRVLPTDAPLARTVVRVGAAGANPFAIDVVIAAARQPRQTPDELLESQVRRSRLSTSLKPQQKRWRRA